MTNYKTTVSKFCINSKRYETLAVVSKNRISNVPKNFFWVEPLICTQCGDQTWNLMASIKWNELSVLFIKIARNNQILVIGPVRWTLFTNQTLDLKTGIKTNMFSVWLM